MNVLIAAEFLDNIQDPSTYNSRFLTVADMLARRGHSVRFVTSDFIHSSKKHASGITEFMGHEMVTLHEPGYQKNISLQRFVSHYFLARRLRKWFRTIEKPDVIYDMYPVFWTLSLN